MTLSGSSYGTIISECFLYGSTVFSMFLISFSKGNFCMHYGNEEPKIRARNHKTQVITSEQDKTSVSRHNMSSLGKFFGSRLKCFFVNRN